MRNFLERQMWMEFGVNPETGHVTISDTDGRDIVTLPPEQAKAVVDAHNGALWRANDDLTALDPWPKRE